MNLDKVKQEWNEYNEEFENSEYMDIDKHTSMALKVGGLINEIEQQREEIQRLETELMMLR
jgi:hypothetical protein